MKPRDPKKIEPDDIVAVYRARAAEAATLPEPLQNPEQLTPSDLEALYMARLRKHLRKSGWVKSVIYQAAVDRAGEALPWYTYACTSFLTKRVQPDFRVFEYGSGQSTIWWSKRVANVTAVEHNPGWYAHVKASMADNVDYILNPKDYARELLNHSPKFDVVVVDGRDRVECGKIAPQGLTDRGVVVWDNANRPIYQEGYDFLASHGFRRMDFDSTGPVWTISWTTTVFYRDGNCLGI